LNIFAAALAFSALSLWASAASAGVLVEGTGWQDDQADAVGTATEQTPWTFTVLAGQTDRFSLSDGFVVGDIYEVDVSGDTTGTFFSTFSALPVNFPTGLGDISFDDAWALGTFSELQLLFGPGSYSLSISDTNCGSPDIDPEALCPAGVGVRLDRATVPEPITLSLFGAGLACAAAMRRRRKATVS
jgi:hypothetical protein